MAYEGVTKALKRFVEASDEDYVEFFGYSDFLYKRHTLWRQVI